MRVKLFDGVEKELIVYNGQAIINFEISFYTEECDDDLDEEEVDFEFSGFVSGYFRVFNERDGREIKDLTMTQSGDALYLNASPLDMTFNSLGNYYYEIGYSDGYEKALMYGILKVI